MINILKFLIISTEQFDNIITTLNCNLTQSDPLYLLTYFFANLLSYLFIFVVIKVSLWMFFYFFKFRR